MSDELDDPDIYAWTHKYDIPMFCVTGVRDLTAADVFDRWHAEPGDRPTHTANTLWTDESWDDGRYGVRVADLGAWTVAIEFMTRRGGEPGWLKALSIDTEAWSWERGGDAMNIFSYAVNGRLLECFEPMMLPSRYSCDQPGLFDTHLTRVGLLPPTRTHDPLPDYHLAMFQMISALYGVQATEDLMFDADLPAAIISI